MAERLWSEPNTTWKEAEQRFLENRQRMVERGIRADAVMPEFCRQNPAYCFAVAKFQQPVHHRILIVLVVFVLVILWVKRRIVWVYLMGSYLRLRQILLNNNHVRTR